MKLAKKFAAAVAMAAVCCAMIVPVTASAAKCPPHSFEASNYSSEAEVTTHEYVFGSLEHEDGTVEVLKGTCTVVTTYYYCDMECQACHSSYPYYLYNTTVSHSACGQ